MRSESRVKAEWVNRLSNKATRANAMDSEFYSAPSGRMKRKRYRVKEGGFVALSPYREKVGQILDINLEGLSFVYILREDIHAYSKNLEIFFMDNLFYLDQIPFRVVYEYVMNRQGYPGFFQMRRCGIAFGALSAYHRHNIEHFIENFCLDQKS